MNLVYPEDYIVPAKAGIKLGFNAIRYSGLGMLRTGFNTPLRLALSGKATGGRALRLDELDQYFKLYGKGKGNPNATGLAGTDTYGMGAGASNYGRFVANHSDNVFKKHFLIHGDPDNVGFLIKESEKIHHTVSPEVLGQFLTKKFGVDDLYLHACFPNKNVGALSKHYGGKLKHINTYNEINFRRTDYKKFRYFLHDYLQGDKIGLRIYAGDAGSSLWTIK